MQGDDDDFFSFAFDLNKTGKWLISRRTIMLGVIKSIFWTIFGLRTFFLIKNWFIAFSATVVALVILHKTLEDPNYTGYLSKEILQHGFWFYPLAGFLFPYSRYMLENSGFLNSNISMEGSPGLIMLFIVLEWLFTCGTIYFLAPIVGVFGLFSLWRDYRWHSKNNAM